MQSTVLYYGLSEAGKVDSVEYGSWSSTLGGDAISNAAVEPRSPYHTVTAAAGECGHIGTRSCVGTRLTGEAGYCCVGSSTQGVI